MWWAHYPLRWAAELDALEATGWRYQVIEDPETGDRILHIDYPVPADEPPHPTPPADAPPRSGSPDHRRGSPGKALDVGRPSGEASAHPGNERFLTLGVTFPEEYPFFPPAVCDQDNPLGLRRHIDPYTGDLCLIEPEDWHTALTVAELLTRQLPRLHAENRLPDPPQGTATTSARDLAIVRSGPAPAPSYSPYLWGKPALLIDEDWNIPTGLAGGGTVIAVSVTRSGLPGVSSLVALTAPDLALRGDPARLARYMPHRTRGSWLRMPDYDPYLKPEHLWKQLRSRLPAQRAEPHQQPFLDGPPADSDTEDRQWLSRWLFDTIALLVPVERDHPERGEDWVFLVRSRATTREPWYYTEHPGMRFGRRATLSRTPEGLHLVDKHVVLVGTGAVGGTIATDLARCGVGRLTLIDGDITDPRTGCRQYAPPGAAGMSKAVVFGTSLAADNPLCEVECHLVAIGHSRHQSRSFRPRRGLPELLRAADLVVDAAADPPLTRYLAATSRAVSTPFLHASATSGGWGGVVALLTDDTGCWACLEHHRADHRFPIPPSDPAGAIAPIGCGEETFTGTNADLASIAHHASRLAHHHLTHRTGSPSPAHLDPLRPGVYIAALRDDDGTPTPIRWSSECLPVHPACPLHPRAGT